MRVRVCVQFFQTCQPRVKKKRRRNSKYDLKRRLMCFSSERPSPGSDRMIKAVHMLRRINWQRQFPHGLVHSPAFSGQLFILTETPQQKNNRLNFSPPFFLQVSPLFSWITGYRLLFVITYRGREMWINVENPWWIQIFPYRAWEPIKKNKHAMFIFLCSWPQYRLAGHCTVHSAPNIRFLSICNDSHRFLSECVIM